MQSLWDVCVTTPTCASYVERNSDTIGRAAADINERHKRAKYEALARSEGLSFVPRVFESFGGFGKSVLGFLSKAGDEAVDLSGGSMHERAQVLEHLRCTIAFALAKGHARFARNSLDLARARKPSAPLRGCGARTDGVDFLGRLGVHHPSAVGLV